METLRKAPTIPVRPNMQNDMSNHWNRNRRCKPRLQPSMLMC